MATKFALLISRRGAMLDDRLRGGRGARRQDRQLAPRRRFLGRPSLDSAHASRRHRGSGCPAKRTARRRSSLLKRRPAGPPLRSCSLRGDASRGPAAGPPLQWARWRRRCRACARSRSRRGRSAGSPGERGDAGGDRRDRRDRAADRLGARLRHWPGCEGATSFPRRRLQYIEFSNRLISGVTILLTLATWLASRWTPSGRRGAPARARDLPRHARAGAARRDHRLLPPQPVARALALPALAGVLSSACVVALEAWDVRGEPLPRGCASSALLVGVAVRRRWSSAARSRPPPGRIPGSIDGVPSAPRVVLAAVYWHVRATAVFGISFAVLLVWLVRRRSRAPALRRCSCSACSLVQMARRRDPVPDRPAVVARARPRHARATLWAATSRSSASLWRPPRVGWPMTGRRASHRRASPSSAAGARRGVPRLERRRPGRLARRRASSRAPGAPSGSRRSTRSASSTSSRRGRTSRSSTARRAGSTGRRTRSSPRRCSTAAATRCSCSAPSRTCAGARSASSSPASPQELGVELVVTLGSLLADVPHTRPAPVTGSATDPALIERLGLQASRYEGPTGIVGVLHDACRAPASRRRRSGRRSRTTSR